MRPDATRVRAATWSAFAQGRLDPTTQWLPERDGGTFRRAALTPDGPGVLVVTGALGDRPNVSAHGPGADWLAHRARAYSGVDDVVPSMELVHPRVRDAERRWGSLRLGASGDPYHELLPAVLGQRITAREACRQWRDLVLGHGERAPDPEGHLRLPPAPSRLAEVPYHDLHELGIEKRRADTLCHVARHAHRLPDVSGGAVSGATDALRRVPGVGPWTAAVAGGLAFGDPDALRVGDFHVKNTIAWALRGVPRGTDEEMLADLAPYVGQRHRIATWLALDGWMAPKFGPRRRIVSIARL